MGLANTRNSTIDPSLTKKLHLMSPEELLNIPVTSLNVFGDSKWYEPSRVPGQSRSTCTINWDMMLHDGSRLTDKQHSRRIWWIKLLILVRVKLPADGNFPAAGMFGSLQQAIKWFASWIAENGLHSPEELSPAVCLEYFESLPRYISEKAHDGEIRESTARIALQLLIDLWNQRVQLQKFGIASLVSHPYGGDGGAALAKRISTLAIGWVRPIPDEVAIPLLNKASWFLGAPANDVIRLIEVVDDRTAGNVVIVDNGRGGTRTQLAGGGKTARLRRTSKFFDNFVFSTIEGEAKPWHEPLDISLEGSVGKQSDAQFRVRQLYEAVRDACLLLVQGTTGMRISEILGISAGIDVSSTLPVGVRIENSRTGLYEWFVIRTTLSKTDDGMQREVDWVLGMRSIGDTELPEAVRALVILNKLTEPWRERAATNRLVLSTLSGFALPTKAAVLLAPIASKVNASMRRFIENWVDLSGLPDTSKAMAFDNDLVEWRAGKGAPFRSHMLRKTWASYVLGCDPKLLPAIQMQYHHSNLAITEGGYIGNNPLLVESLDSVARQKRNSVIFELVTGQSALAGRMGGQLNEATTQLKVETIDLPLSEKWKKVEAWADENQLQLFFSQHANCAPIRRSEMRCQDATDTPVWIRNVPNTATREPSLCAGCACAIIDRSHERFWVGRYVDSMISIRASERIQSAESEFRVIKFRAAQADSILRKFGTDREDLQAKVELAWEAENA